MIRNLQTARKRESFPGKQPICPIDLISRSYRPPETGTIRFAPRLAELSPLCFAPPRYHGPISLFVNISSASSVPSLIVFVLSPLSLVMLFYFLQVVCLSKTSLSFSPSLSISLSCFCFVSLPLCSSLARAHTDTQTHTHTHSLSLSLSISVSMSYVYLRSCPLSCFLLLSFLFPPLALSLFK